MRNRREPGLPKAACAALLCLIAVSLYACGETESEKARPGDADTLIVGDGESVPEATFDVGEPQSSGGGESIKAETGESDPQNANSAEPTMQGDRAESVSGGAEEGRDTMSGFSPWHTAHDVG